MYFHQIIKKNIQGKLKLTYNNTLRASEFISGIDCIDETDRITIADVIQILSIVYNIGHFYNTFTASRAIIMIAERDSNFINFFNSGIEDERFHETAKKIFSTGDYHRMHLLNSLMVLEQCDLQIKSVKLAKEIIYAYINENALESMSKLHYVFKLFRTVRNVAYVAYDLQIANTPFTLDIGNEKAMLSFFEELLSEFNNREAANNLIESVQKLLDDAVYNQSDNVICYYKISKQIYRKMIENRYENVEGFYQNYWLDKDSIFNKKYSQNHDYVKEGMLKLTFGKQQQQIAKELLIKLEKLNNVRVGYYNRYYGEMTIVASVNEKCGDKKKVAFQLMKVVVKYLKMIDDIESNDPRFLLITKFFIRYVFDENPIIIKSALDEKKCVICTRGSKKRISTLQLILNSANGCDDDIHEVQAIINFLKTDNVNDVTITISGSTVVYSKNNSKELCEFDGIIIYPNRKENQIILIEAKNTTGRPSYGKNCLKRKIEQLRIQYDVEKNNIINYDSYYKLSI